MLATLVILGILAAISLPTFVGKDHFAMDAEAGFSWGNGGGQVRILRGGSRTTQTQVTIRGFSDAVSGGRRHRYDFISAAVLRRIPAPAAPATATTPAAATTAPGSGRPSSVLRTGYSPFG